MNREQKKNEIFKTFLHNTQITVELFAARNIKMVSFLTLNIEQILNATAN